MKGWTANHALAHTWRPLCDTLYARHSPLAAQFPYLEAVFSETLRLFPPTHLANRHAAEGLNVGGSRSRPGRRCSCEWHPLAPPDARISR